MASIGFEVDRDQPRARLLAGRGEARHGVGRVQTRIIAELVARLELACDPLGRRLVDDVAELEHRSVRLGLHLRRVAPVDEQRRRVLQHDRDPGRAGETRSAI